MATKKLQVLANLGPTDAKIKSAVEEHFVDHPIDSTLIDKLCPAFTESGSVVTCQPVEGYPLAVTAEEGATTITRCGKNLVVYPYTGKTKTLYGITFTDNGDGSITINGTATANAVFYLRNREKWSVKPGEKYTGKLHKVSGSKTGNMQFVINYYPTGVSYYLEWLLAANFGTTTGACPSNMNYMAAYLLVLSGTTCTNLVVRPQLEYGTVATEYVPYQATQTYAAGEQIPALPGVNTLYADTGEITVTGRADPRVALDRLTNAVLSLGGNV